MSNKYYFVIVALSCTYLIASLSLINSRDLIITKVSKYNNISIHLHIEYSQYILILYMVYVRIVGLSN